MSKKNTAPIRPHELAAFDVGEIRKTLQDCLIVFNVTLLDFARSVGMSRQGIGFVLDGKRKPTQRTLYAIVAEMQRRNWINPIISDDLRREKARELREQADKMLAKAMELESSL